MQFRSFLALMLAAVTSVVSAQEIDIRPLPSPAKPTTQVASIDLGIRPLVAAAATAPTEKALAVPLPSNSQGGLATASAAKRWEVRTSDVTLNATFARWAAEAGYRLRWDSKKNILIEAPDVFVGTFEQALSQALSSPGILYGDHPLEACVYPNNPLLIRVTRQGEQARECPEVISQ